MKSNKYDLVELQGKIGSDEPVFLIRGQDITAPKVIRFWAQEQRIRGGDQKMADAAELVAEQMTAWQEATGKCKLADGPQSRDTRETKTAPPTALETSPSNPGDHAVITRLEQQLKDTQLHLKELQEVIRNGKAENIELKNTVDRLTSEKLATGSNDRPALGGGGVSISSASNEAGKSDTIPDQSGKPVDVSDSPIPRGSDSATTETASSPNAS